MLGDFNADERNPAYRSLVTNRRVGLRDAFRAVHRVARVVGTFNALRGDSSGGMIDHVLAGPGWRILAAGIDRRKYGALWPSDHFPVWAVLHNEGGRTGSQLTALAGKPDMKHFDRWFAATNALRTKGTEHLLNAASAAGVRRFIAQSFTGWTNIREGGPIKTEDDPLDPNPAKEQVVTLGAIRFLERAVTEAPLEGMVLRYGSFYGSGASDTLVAMVRRRLLPIIGGGADAERAESVSMAFLLLLERLNPVERAVLLLHDVFGYEFDEIATIVGKAEANCRLIAAIVLAPDGQLTNVFSIDIRDGRVQAIRSVINPDKLNHIGTVADVRALMRSLGR